MDMVKRKNREGEDPDPAVRIRPRSEDPDPAVRILTPAVRTPTRQCRPQPRSEDPDPAVQTPTPQMLQAKVQVERSSALWRTGAVADGRCGVAQLLTAPPELGFLGFNSSHSKFTSSHFLLTTQSAVTQPLSDIRHCLLFVPGGHFLTSVLLPYTALSVRLWPRVCCPWSVSWEKRRDEVLLVICGVITPSAGSRGFTLGFTSTRTINVCCCDGVTEELDDFSRTATPHRTSRSPRHLATQAGEADSNEPLSFLQQLELRGPGTNQREETEVHFYSCSAVTTAVAVVCHHYRPSPRFTYYFKRSSNCQLFSQVSQMDSLPKKRSLKSQRPGTKAVQEDV
ncbi:hypothetical protein U0070_002535 [Myodes glareolus]|uniref:Uncharacterized protein n=1 Tax=Myodes glareolus TaxID=447135 RepID=A0AAW0HPE5_MYOGA